MTWIPRLVPSLFRRSVCANYLNTWAPPVLVVLLTVDAYAQFVGVYFQGGDTWPHIWTSRVSGGDDLLRNLTRPIMYGTVFPDRVALFFRPVSTLSYAWITRPGV
jgi:hypothetical protein